LIRTDAPSAAPLRRSPCRKRRHQDDGNLRPLLADPRQQAEIRHVWQPQIQQHEIRSVAVAEFLHRRRPSVASAISYPRAESVSATDHRSSRSSSTTSTQRRADFFAASGKFRGVSAVEVAVSANICASACSKIKRRASGAGARSYRAASASVTSDAMSWTSNGLLTTR
jgi:hypothetical protein